MSGRAIFWPLRQRGGHEAYEQQQGLLERDLLAELVDQVEPFGSGVDDRAEVGAHHLDQALHVGDVDAQLGRRHRRLLLVGEGVQRDDLGVQVGQHEGQHERHRRV